MGAAAGAGPGVTGTPPRTGALCRKVHKNPVAQASRPCGLVGRAQTLALLDFSGLAAGLQAQEALPALQMTPDYPKGPEVQEAEHFLVDLAINYAYVRFSGP
jgi:hypothetical protein